MSSIYSSSCGRSAYFFFNDTATTEIYTLSLHDALPICSPARPVGHPVGGCAGLCWVSSSTEPGALGEKGDPVCPREPSAPRSEEHTSELQSRQYLVCRLLLEKKNQNTTTAVLRSSFILR